MVHDFADDVVLFERAAKRMRELGHKGLAAQVGAAAGSLTRGKAPPGGTKEPAKCEKCGGDVLRVGLADPQGAGTCYVEKDIRTTVHVGDRRVVRAWVSHECPRGTVLRT